MSEHAYWCNAVRDDITPSDCNCSVGKMITGNKAEPADLGDKVIKRDCPHCGVTTVQPKPEQRQAENAVLEAAGSGRWRGGGPFGNTWEF